MITIIPTLQEVGSKEAVHLHLSRAVTIHPTTRQKKLRGNILPLPLHHRHLHPCTNKPRHLTIAIMMASMLMMSMNHRQVHLISILSLNRCNIIMSRQSRGISLSQMMPRHFLKCQPVFFFYIWHWVEDLVWIMRWGIVIQPAIVGIMGRAMRMIDIAVEEHRHRQWVQDTMINIHHPIMIMKVETIQQMQDDNKAHPQIHTPTKHRETVVLGVVDTMTGPIHVTIGIIHDMRMNLIMRHRADELVPAHPSPW